MERMILLIKLFRSRLIKCHNVLGVGYGVKSIYLANMLTLCNRSTSQDVQWICELLKCNLKHLFDRLVLFFTFNSNQKDF